MSRAVSEPGLRWRRRRQLHDYEVKLPNLTFYGGRGHTTTNFPFSFWTSIKSLRIQLQEKSPAFDILSGSKWTRLSLKELKFIFLATFSLPSLLKVPYVFGSSTTFQRRREWICESGCQVSGRLHVFAGFFCPWTPPRLHFMLSLHFSHSLQSSFCILHPACVLL